MASISTPGLSVVFPDRGSVSEDEYLRLTDHTNRLVELVDGRIEELPMPTEEHQEIILFLVNFLRAFVRPAKLGKAIQAGLRVRLAKAQFREPDVVFILQANFARAGNRYWDFADLVMEVVSEDDPNRDYIVKRRVYAAAGISEYWIVDSRTQTILVLKLEGDQYVTHCQTAGTGLANSALLPGFAVETADVFAAGRSG
jgi:Uma2 family endonuclease